METHISWLIEGAVKPGELAALSVLIDDMVTSTREEPGSLIFEFFAGGDGDQVHVYERFADAAAALVHLSTFGERFAGRFLATTPHDGSPLWGTQPMTFARL